MTPSTPPSKGMKMATLYKTLAVCVIAATSFSAPAFADTYHHIDELALRIASKSQQIVCESRHYRHTPEYRHIVSDARAMHQFAEHIHEVAHHHGSLIHLEQDLVKLDAEFHHLENLFDRVEHRAAYGHGHIHGNTAHVKRLLNSIEDDIHHLQSDLRSLRTPVSRNPVVLRRPPVYTAPRYNYGHHAPHGHRNGYGSSYRGGGITIGGGSSRFTIRF